MELQKKSIWFLFAMAFVVAFSCHGQFTVDGIGKPVGALTEADDLEDLALLAKYVATYDMLLQPEKDQWLARVKSPYPSCKTPLDSSLVNWLYQILESDELRTKDSYWSFACSALSILMSATSQDPRLTACAKGVLTVPRVPEQAEPDSFLNTVGSAVSVLMRSQQPDDRAFALSAETPAFWKGRWEKLHLQRPPQERFIPFRGAPDEALLTIRGLVATSIAWMGHGEDGIAYLKALAEKNRENPLYQRYLASQVETLQNRSAANLRIQDEFRETAAKVLPSEGQRPSVFETRRILSARIVESIRPDIEGMFKENRITEAVRDACKVIDDTQGRDSTQRLDACRALTGNWDLPFELLRWATMCHVMVEEAPPDEMEKVAYRYLEKFDNDWNYSARAVEDEQAK